MNAINLISMLQGGGIPQAASAALDPQTADGMFAQLLGQYSPAAGSGLATALQSAGAQTQIKQADGAWQSELLAMLQAVLQQIEGGADTSVTLTADPDATATADTDTASASTEQLAQAVLDALMQLLREILDAGSTAQTLADASTSAVLPAGDGTAEAAHSAAAVTLLPSDNAVKQAAVTWLQPETPADRQAAVTYLQTGGLVVKQATASTVTPETWHQVLAQLQDLLAQAGVHVQTSQTATSSQTAGATPVPWALVPGTVDAATVLEKLTAWLDSAGQTAELQPVREQLQQLLDSLTNTEVTSRNQALSATPAPNAWQELSSAPASIRWFAQGGLGTAAVQAETAPVVNTAAPVLAGATAALELPDGSQGRIVVVAAPATAALSGASSPASEFNLALLSQDATAPVLTARLNIKHMAEKPAMPLATQPELPSAQVSRPLSTNAAIQSGTTATSAWNLPTAQTLTPQMFTAATVQAAAALQPQLAPQLNVRAKEALLKADVVATSIDEADTVAEALPIAPQAVSALDNGVARRQDVLRQAHWLSTTQAEPTADAVPTSPTANLAAGMAPPPTAQALLGPTGLPQKLAATAELGSTETASATQQVSGATATAGLAFNTLPAQLMQFTDRQLDLKPYTGLEFRELAAKLLDQTTAAHGKGDGLYQATLDLNPPSLGRMAVNIAVRGESVALQLAVASNVPKEQLKGSLAALQRSLEEAGLQVVELKVVTVDPDGQPARHGYESDADQAGAPVIELDGADGSFSDTLSLPEMEFALA